MVTSITEMAARVGWGQGERRTEGSDFGADALHIPKKQLLLFFTPFARLVAAGIAHGRAVKSIVESTPHANMRRVLHGVASRLDNGEGLADACSHYPLTFDRTIISALETGEDSGQLASACHDIVAGLKKDVKMARQLATAAIYPVSALALLVISVGLNLLKVTPKFAVVYAQIPVDRLPPMTRVLLAASNVYVAHTLTITAGFLLGVWVLVLWMRSVEGQRGMARWLTVFGPVRRWSEGVIGVQWLRHMGRLTRSGKAAAEAAAIAARGVPLPGLQERYESIAIRLGDGEPLSEEMATSGLFPPEIITFIRAGEDAGNVAEMLGDAAEFAGDDVEDRLNRLLELMPSALILLVGSVVAFLTISEWQGVFALQRFVR